MNCKKCQKPMLVESLEEGKTRVSCQPCGITEVRDPQGRQLLTSGATSPPTQLLTEDI